MNINKKKIIEWIKWDQWKLINKRLIGRIKKHGSWLIERIKGFFDMVVKGVRWMIVPVAFLTLFATLIIAANNYFSLNLRLLDILNRLKNDMEKLSVQEWIKFLKNLDELKRAVFDSNALTFMVTLIIVFLGTILLNIENRARSHIEKAEKIINRLEAERSTISLYSQIQLLQIFSTNLLNALITTHYIIDTFIIALSTNVFNSAECLLEDFSNDKYKSITPKDKEAIDNMMINMIGHIELDYILIIPENAGKTQPVEDAVMMLEKVQKEISKLREV